MLKSLKFYLTFSFFFLFFIELSSLFLIEYFGYTILQPRFRKTKIASNKFPQNADIDKDFGVWHIPNTSFHHIENCFNVKYYYTSYGARDTERTNFSPHKRIFFMGDSFVEGFGVDTSNRVSNILEKQLDLEVMNFGTSGNFASTQMRLLYKKFGKKFKHDLVLIGILPENDFAEDNIEIGKIQHNNRYRPYLLPEKEGYKISYIQQKLEDSDWYPNSLNLFTARIETFFRNYCYTYQIYAAVSYRYLNYKLKELVNHNSKFFDFTPTEIEILLYNLSKINQLAKENNSEMMIFTIPRRKDFQFFKEKVAENKLNPVLTEFCKVNNIKYVDLFPIQINYKNPEYLFHNCDDHWSTLGNKDAASILLLPITNIIN